MTRILQTLLTVLRRLTWSYRQYAATKKTKAETGQMTDEKKSKWKAEAGGQEETCSETQQLKERTKKETLFRNPPTKKSNWRDGRTQRNVYKALESCHRPVRHEGQKEQLHKKT